jgi:hypothetical protein
MILKPLVFRNSLFLLILLFKVHATYKLLSNCNKDMLAAVHEEEHHLEEQY